MKQQVSSDQTFVCLRLTAQLKVVRSIALVSLQSIVVSSVLLLLLLDASSSTTLALQQPPPFHQQHQPRVNFTDCGPRNVKEVRITPCPGDGLVCNINLGTNVTVEADFIAKHDASSLSEIIKGVVRGRELQFPEQRSDPCKSTISPSCPIRQGKFYQYKASFEIKPYYPAIPVKVRYALANQNGEVVACVQIAARIVDPSPVARTGRNKPKNKKNN